MAGTIPSSQWTVIVEKDTEGNYIAKSVNDKKVKKDGDKYIEDTGSGLDALSTDNESNGDNPTDETLSGGKSNGGKSKKNKSKGGKSKSKRGLKKSRKQRK